MVEIQFDIWTKRAWLGRSSYSYPVNQTRWVHLHDTPQDRIDRPELLAAREHSLPNTLFTDGSMKSDIFWASQYNTTKQPLGTVTGNGALRIEH